MTEHPPATLDFVADIVSAYLAHNSVSHGEIPALIASVHRALTTVAGGQAEVSQVEQAGRSD